MFNKFIYFFIFLLTFATNSASSSLENKILFKINNQIITTQDILDQITYLGILNENFFTLEKDQIFEISKNSLIKKKIKKMELSRKFPNVKINQDYLDKLLQNNYNKLGLSNLEDFKTFLNNKELDIKIYEENLLTNALWNEFISVKYKNKIKINKDKLLYELKNKQSKERYSYLLSEIVFSSQNNEIDNLIEEINKSIVLNGFENTALKYSISNSANLGGKIGWIQEDALSNLILKEIKNLNEGDYTQPINIPSGFIILKINKLKKDKIKVDINKELEKLINQKKNDQFNNFSNIYFNKIKKEYQIDEL